jgi:ABC-type polysaccharide/polyol phosphate transport system ATPase subunit
MSKKEPLAISIKGVSKLFRLQKQRTFKDLLPALAGGQKAVETFWALQDINLEIKKGETLGIIGPNGAGKSTLLKLMAGVTKPTKGEIKINGDIAPLIELGAGFHPELTGRENITLNGVILGMSREQVAEKFKEIVDFAELWEFIDQPIKHYSSGMYLRLAFSVAVHTKPDILLIDEILAVGDESFKQKCFKKMEEFKKEGVTIVLVSHVLEQMKEFCSRAVYLDEHKIIMDGGVEKVCERYLQETV